VGNPSIVGVGRVTTHRILVVSWRLNCLERREVLVVKPKLVKKAVLQKRKYEYRRYEARSFGDPIFGDVGF